MAASLEYECRLLVQGRRVDGAAQPITIYDKYSGEAIATAHVPAARQIDDAVEQAHAAWRLGVPGQSERAQILERAAAGVERAATELIRLMQQEAGFPGADGEAEVRRCAQTLRLSAAVAREFAGEVVPLAGSPGQSGKFGFTLRVPLGVVLAVTPFNSPLNTVTHKIAPAFAAGNAVILKPSSETPVTASKFAQILLDAGMPPGLLSILHGGAEVVHRLLEQPAIRYIAFTGSTATGRAIMRAAGLRRTQMELGSIACTILCDDADLDLALPKIVNAAYRKAGQVCTSVQILLVHQSLRLKVEDRLAALTAEVPYGDPADPRTVTGPVINDAAAVRIESWIDGALATGARRLVGGPRKRRVLPPTLLTDVDDRMDVVRLEVFGPVLCIRTFDDLTEAIELVNRTPYGLATGIFTQRIEPAFLAIRNLEVGSVYVNDTSSSRVDVMPYGGSKDSGFGREGPKYAAREMSEERMITFANVGT
jgi:acyl-CoA reductase-like NAD-dependent aldehyde dehydrogenase